MGELGQARGGPPHFDADVPCRIGLWGTFDTGAFGDALAAQIIRRELAARLPAAQIRTMSPLGSGRPTPRDGGTPPEALGAWRPERAENLGRELDCVIVAGASLFPDNDDLTARYRIDRQALEELAPDRFFVEGTGTGDASCPTIWFGVQVPDGLSASDQARLRAVAGTRGPVTTVSEPSRRHLAGAGVEATLIPDVALLASRLHSPDLLAKRLDYLRLMGWYPAEGAPVLIEGGFALLPFLPALAAGIEALRAERPGLGVVVAEMGTPGDEAFAAALAAEISGDVHRLPAAAGLEDLCAAIAACGVFAGSSARGAFIALSHGRPQVLLGLPGSEAVEEVVGLTGDESLAVRRPEDITTALELALATPASPAWVAGLVQQVDASLDRLAACAAAAAARARHGAHRSPDAERVIELEDQLAHLGVAHDARSRRLATERMVFANHLRKAEEEIALLKAETSRLRDEVARVLNRVAQAEATVRSESEARQAAEAELVALRATRTFRYTAELRTAYGQLRRIANPPERPASPPEQPQHP
jgi:hypothetical protein